MRVIALIRSHGAPPAGITEALAAHDVATAVPTRGWGTVVRVLVTGGAGFLGSHLCDSLIARGHTVVCLDDLSTGRRANIEPLGTFPEFSFVEASVLDPMDFQGRFDGVVHLASPASPSAYLQRPIFTLRTGSEGTRNVLDFAKTKSARFVLASTSEVYGEPLVHPQPETYWGNVNPVGPRSVYDEAKRYAEALTTAYRTSCGANTGIVRIFNTYGPRMCHDDGRVVSNFIDQALNSKPLTVYGDGTQTRSLCYVDDLVHGIVGMLESDDPGPINLGNPVELSVLAIAELVLELVQSASRIELHPLPQDDPTRRRPDITRAHDRLGWKPQISVRDGLARTIEWYAKALQAALHRERA
jgi:dTDP-glucose 4,6-dehydratase